MSDERKQKPNPPRMTSKSRGKGRGSKMRSLIIWAIVIAAVLLFVLNPNFNIIDVLKTIGQFGTDAGNVISGWINDIFNSPPITITPDGDVNLGNG